MQRVRRTLTQPRRLEQNDHRAQGHSCARPRARGGQTALWPGAQQTECHERQKGGVSAGTMVPLCSYTHSIVAGGFEVTSRTTRLTPGISLTIRDEIVSS